MLKRGYSSILGIILVLIGVSTLAYGTYQRYSTKTIMNSLLDTSSVEVLQDSDSILDGDMQIKEVVSNYSVIEIPDLNIKAPITDGVEENLSYSVGMFPNSPKLSESGNVSLAGHSSSIYACVFNNIDTLVLGDKINIYDENGDLREYTLVQTKVVIPTDVGVLRDFKDNRLTIVTCTDGGNMRLILVCKELSVNDRLDLVRKSSKERVVYASQVLSDLESSYKELSNTYNKRLAYDKVEYNNVPYIPSFSPKKYISGVGNSITLSIGGIK